MKKKALMMFLISVAAAATLGAAGCEEEHVHSWVVGSNEGYHWKECNGKIGDNDCGVMKDLEAHVDANSDGKCDTCEASVHSHAYSWKSDDGYHWQECGGKIGDNDCGDKKDFGAHVDADSDGKCDTCTADVHIHSYEWKSDENTHWQECVMGEKVNYGGHVDVANNETGAEGKDGLCDTCGLLSKVVVSFNMFGVAEAPETTKIDYGTKITAPTAPEVQGYIFDKWYADDEFETPFDFENTAITEDTVIYAHYTDDETPGMSAKYPVPFEIDSLTDTAAFGKWNKLYFSFTAETKGRYSVTLNNLSAACTFTTSLDDGTVYEGTANKNFDLDAGESIIVIINRAEGMEDTDEVGAYVTAVVNEPLPDDGWGNGEYKSGYYEMQLDRASNQVTWMEFESVGFNYVGGSFDTMTFTVGNSMFGTSTFTATRVPDTDNLKITATGRLASFTDLVFTYDFKPIPVAVDKFSGVFLPEAAPDPAEDEEPVTAGVASISKIGIYESGNGYIIQEGRRQSFAIGKDGSRYNTEYNILTYGGNYKIEIKELDADGKVISVTVTYGAESWVYLRAENEELLEEIPEDFDLENGQYAGTKNTLYVTQTATYLNTIGGWQLRIVDYSKDTGVYTCTQQDTRYFVTIEKSDDNVTIKLYDADNTLVDTLTKYEVKYHDMPAAETNVTLTAADIQKGKYYYYKVTDAGWYNFTSTDDNLVIYANVSADDPEGSATLVELGKGVKLAADSIVRVECGADGTAFTLAPCDAPEGMAENNPFKMTDVGVFEIAKLLKATPQYIEFNAPSAGTYVITCTFTYWGSSSDLIQFYVNDTAYGYNPVSWGYHKAGKTATVTVTEDNLKIKIKVDMTNGDESTYNDIKVKVVEDFTDVKQALDLDVEDEGTVNASGVYYADLDHIAFADTLTLKSDSEFTIIYGALVQSVKEITLDYGLAVSGFRLVLGAEQTVSCSVDYLEGAAKKHAKIEEIGTTSYNVNEVSNLVYIDVTAPEGDLNTIISVTDDTKFFFFDEDYTQYTSYHLAAGQKVTIMLGCNEAKYAGSISVVFDYDLTVDAEEAYFVNIPVPGNQTVTASIVELNAGSSNVHFDKSLTGNLYVTGSEEFEVLLSNGTNIEATYNNGMYELTISSFGGQYVKFTTEVEQTLTLATVYVLGTEGNPYVVSLTGGSFTSASVARNATIYLVSSVGGTFVYTSSGNRTELTLNGKPVEAGVEFTVYEGDKLVFVNTATAARTFTLKLVVPTVLTGTYEYTEDEATTALVIENNTMTIGETVYTLTATVGNEYTFTTGTGDTATTVTVTLGDTLLFGETPMTFKPVFTAEQSVLWVGEAEGNLRFKLSLLPNGLYTYVEYENGSPYDLSGRVTVTDVEGTKVYELADDITFTFNADGTISLNEPYFDTPEAPFEVTLSVAKPVAGVSYTGSSTFSPDGVEEIPVTITIKLDEGLTGGKYWFVEGDVAAGGKDAEDDSAIIITVTVENGVYSYHDAEYTWATGTFTYDGDNIILSDDYYGEFTLSPVPASEEE